MSYLRVTVRLCFDGKLEEKCFDDVKDLYSDDYGYWVRIRESDGKTTTWFNKDHVYEVITEVKG